MSHILMNHSTAAVATLFPTHAHADEDGHCASHTTHTQVKHDGGQVPHCRVLVLPHVPGSTHHKQLQEAGADTCTTQSVRASGL
jgi:hypothetical protein